MIKSLPQINRINPYTPPLEKRESFEGLRLDFNERLTPLPPNVVKTIKSFDPQRSIIYPSYNNLRDKIAKYAEVKSENILVTNGSDQGMEIIFRTFISSKDITIIPSPSFAMFYQVTKIQGSKILKPQYKTDGNFPLEKVITLLKKKPKILIICNPNNPTGTIVSLGEIETILKEATNTLIYIDEAYFEFSNITATKLINKYSNLVITRTFSKAFGLAALRVGYIVSCKKNIDEFQKVRGPYDVNQVAKIAAEASLKSLSNLKRYCNEIMNISKPMVENFFQNKKIKFVPSSGNFIYFKEPYKKFYEKIKKYGILIRPKANGYARVTIGTIKQMKQFIRIFNKIS